MTMRSPLPARPTMMRIALTAIAALALAACDGGEATTDYVEPEAGPDRTTCDQSDFAGAPLMGPGFADGVYVGPTDAPVVVASTVLYVFEDDEAAFALFGQTVEQVVGALMQADGLLGFALGNSERCTAYRTLTVWRDMASMLAFVVNDAHLAAMEAAPDMAESGSRTVHWTVDPAVEPVDWPSAITRTDAAVASDRL